MPRKKSKKGSAARPGQTLIAAWVPDPLVKMLEQAAKEQDLTKSQILRRAIQNSVR